MSHQASSSALSPSRLRCAALALMLSGLVACSGGGGGSDPAPTPTPTPQPTANACNGEPDPTSNNLTDGPQARWVLNPANPSQAFMDGVIDGSTPGNLTAFLDANGGVTEIVLRDCPGSEDDHSNIRACRIVRERRLNTRLLSSSVIASGAVDFFIAGVRRIDAPGSQILVHSWSTGDGTVGRDVPREDCQHQLYIRYYEAMGLPDPSGFYFKTLESGIPTVNLTEAERMQYQVSTE